MLKPLVTSQFTVTLDGLSARFTRVSQRTMERTEAEYNDGSTGVTRKVLGFKSYANITLGMPYDVAVTSELISALADAHDAGTVHTIAVTPVSTTHKGDPIPGARTQLLTGCQVMAIRWPEVDRSGSDAAMVEIELTVDEITEQ